MNIFANFIEFDHSTTLIASSDENYGKAIGHLSKAIVTKKLTVMDKNLYLLRDINILKKMLTLGMPDCQKVDIEVNIEDNFQSCSIKVTGRDHDVHNVLSQLRKRLNSYYSYLVTTTMSIDALKMKYIQLYLKNIIQEIERIYHCTTNIQFNPPFESLSDNDRFMDKVQVDIRYPKRYQVYVLKLLFGHIRSIKIEKDWTVSKFSNLGRYLQSPVRSKALIEALQDEFKCVIYVKERNSTLPR